jgi:hypothetical protein
MRRSPRGVRFVALGPEGVGGGVVDPRVVGVVAWRHSGRLAGRRPTREHWGEGQSWWRQSIWKQKVKGGSSLAFIVSKGNGGGLSSCRLLETEERRGQWGSYR